MAKLLKKILRKKKSKRTREDVNQIAFRTVIEATSEKRSGEKKRDD